MTRRIAKKKRRNRALSAVGIVLAAILLWLIFRQPDVSATTILSLMRGVSLWGLIMVVGLTLAIFTLSAYQWREALRLSATKPEEEVQPPLSTLTHFTALGALLGMLIPMQASIPLVRSAMMRLHDETSLVRSGATSIVEQGFALFIPLVLSIPGILALQGIISETIFVLIAGGCLVVGWGLVVSAMPATTRVLIMLYERMPDQHLLKRLRILRYGFDSLSNIVDTALFQRRNLSQFYLVAIVRYIVLMMRIMLMLLLFQVDLPIIYALYMVPTIQVMQLVNLTPGNLGLREWTWVGLLHMAGIDASTAANFALAQRLLIVVAIVISNILLHLILISTGPGQRARHTN